jgi:hypothetical protein
MHACMHASSLQVRVSKFLVVAHYRLVSIVGLRNETAVLSVVHFKSVGTGRCPCIHSFIYAEDQYLYQYQYLQGVRNAWALTYYPRD